MTAVSVDNRERSSSVSLLRVPAGVFMIAGLVVLALLLVADRFGYLGDEFYFVVTGRHSQLAAPDNPMLVPYLAAAWYAAVGGHLWAFRILPALAAGGYVLLGGLVAREFGASRSHQVAAAAVVAMTALTLAVGHLFETTTFDMLITAAALGFSFGRCERSRSAGRPGSASAYSPVSRWRSRSWPRRYWCAVSLVLSPSGRGADWQACDLGLPPSLR